jgi:hypothetical protein
MEERVEQRIAMETIAEFKYINFTENFMVFPLQLSTFRETSLPPDMYHAKPISGTYLN